MRKLRKKGKCRGEARCTAQLICMWPYPAPLLSDLFKKNSNGGPKPKALKASAAEGIG